MVIFRTMYDLPEKLDKIVVNESKNHKLNNVSDFMNNKYGEIINELNKDQIINMKKDEKIIKEAVKKQEKKDDEIKKAIEQEIFRNNKKRHVIYYYTSKHKNNEIYNFYVYTPGGIKIFRVPSTVLGFGVLGRAWIGTNVIEILENLSGNDFEEVKKHEINHILFPYLTEGEIRMKTRSELPFYAKYN